VFASRRAELDLAFIAKFQQKNSRAKGTMRRDWRWCETGAIFFDT
jgi:hypothetical protein